MTNELVKIESTQLEEVVKNSGLAIQEGEEIKQSYIPFIVQLAEIQSQASKINFENPQEIDETIARELRLKTVKIRTGSSDLKDSRKRIHLLKGNLEQAAFNLIAASCKLTEETFIAVEKAREIAEKKRQQELRKEREEKLSPYVENPAIYPLGLMSEDEFDALYTSFKSAYEAKIEAEKKAEAERLAAIEAEKKRQEEIRLENERLKKQAEEKEIKQKALRIERKNAALVFLSESGFKDTSGGVSNGSHFIGENHYSEFETDKELDNFRDGINKERLAEFERKKQADILAEEKRKADAEREKAANEKKLMEQKLEQERIKRENIEAETKRKEAAEKAKADADKKAKAAAEKKAKLAPDKTKLLAFGQALNDVPRPEIKSIEAAEVMATINGLLVKLNNYIIEQANKL